LFSPVEFAARPEAVWLPTSLRIIRIRLPRLVDVFA